MPNYQPDNGNQDEDDSSTPGGNGPSSPVTIYDAILYSDTYFNINGIRYVSGSCLVSDDEVWRFCNVGTVSGIDKLTTIPWTGWDALVSVRSRSGVVAYHPTHGYMTIFVAQELTDESGNIEGIYVIYRPNFTGVDEPIELQTNSIKAPCDGLSVEIPIISKSYTPFEVMVVDEKWCHAGSTTVDGMFMPSRISVRIDPNDSPEPRETRIVVGTIYGKSTEINVSQAGLTNDDEEDN